MENRNGANIPVGVLYSQIGYDFGEPVRVLVRGGRAHFRKPARRSPCPVAARAT